MTGEKVTVEEGMGTMEEERSTRDRRRDEGKKGSESRCVKRMSITGMTTGRKDA